MPFTLWSRDVLVGETDFELGERVGPHRAGVFRPAPSGMMLLPALTAMAPALFELGMAARELGLAPDSESEDEQATLDLIESSTAGKKMLASASQIASLELRDGSGKQIAIESILVSDLQELRALHDALDEASEVPEAEDEEGRPHAGDAELDPVRYLISATFTQPGRRRQREVAREQ